MKFMAIAFLISFAGQTAFAQGTTKPENITVEIQQDISVKAADSKSSDTPFTTVSGLNGAACSIYNLDSAKAVTLTAGTKVRLRAAFWESEASWEAEEGSKQPSISMSCFGGSIQSEIRSANPGAPDLTPAVLEQINSAMKGQLRVEMSK